MILTYNILFASRDHVFLAYKCIKMKAFLFVLMVLPSFAFAQECKVIKETDPYTKETRYSSGLINLQSGNVSVEADSKEIDFFFTVEGKCFNDASTVYIFFEGSKVRTTYRNAGGMNCDGYFHFKFKNNKATTGVLQKLTTQKVAQFVFTDNSKKETIVSLLPDQQESFINLATCLVNEAKQLIK